MITYVTTFNKTLYESTGKKMLESFCNTGQDGTMIVCYEDDIKDDIEKSFKNKFLLYNLSTDKYLLDWLEENKEVIPVQFGGMATEASCLDAFKVWNFRASGWFRKIAALNYAKKIMSRGTYSLIFVDCDCIFTKKIEQKKYFSVFANADYFYHWGSFLNELL